MPHTFRMATFALSAFLLTKIVAAQAPEAKLPPVTVKPEAAGSTDSVANPELYQQGYDEGYQLGLMQGSNASNSGAGNSGGGLDFYGQRGSIPWRSNALSSDTDLVGPYNQPLWTTQRPFSATRVFVLPPGQMQVEQWARPTYPRDGKPEYRFLTEYALGLPYRFQLDLYERWNVEPDGANKEQTNHEGLQAEVRWAFANWGVIPLNPTLYAEWVERGGPQDKPDKYELKLLLAEQIGEKWFYATNFILEQEVAGGRENELGWSTALSRTIIDRKLMAGMECLLSGVNEAGARDTRSTEFTIGPTLQARFGNRWYFNTTALFGTTNDAPACQCYFILGYQFGNRAGPAGSNFAPTSTIGN